MNIILMMIDALSFLVRDKKATDKIEPNLLDILETEKTDPIDLDEIEEALSR